MDDLNPTNQPSLERIQALVEENHKMLRSIKRSMWISTILDVLRLLIVVVPLIILAYILPPLISKYVGMYDQYQQAIDGTNGTMPQGFDIKQIQDLLNKSGLLER